MQPVAGQDPGVPEELETFQQGREPARGSHSGPFEDGSLGLWKFIPDEVLSICNSVLSDGPQNMQMLLCQSVVDAKVVETDQGPDDGASTTHHTHT